MTRLLAIIAASIAAAPAFAHHPTGGDAPQTVANGLLSGLAHPVIGIDHLAFIVLVGLAAAGAARLVAGPAAFIVATVIGTLVHVGGVTLPLAPLVIGLATVALGALLIAGRKVSGPLALAGFAFAGLFHGWSYGGAVLGATTMPIVAYLVGFALIQFAIAAGIAWFARSLTADAEAPAWFQPRIAAALCVGVGIAVFALEVEDMVEQASAQGSVVEAAQEEPAQEAHDHDHDHDHGHDDAHDHDHD